MTVPWVWRCIAGVHAHLGTQMSTGVAASDARHEPCSLGEDIVLMSRRKQGQSLHEAVTVCNGYATTVEQCAY